MHTLIESCRAEILSLTERSGLCDLRVFDFMTRGDTNENSDVGLLTTTLEGTFGLACCNLAFAATFIARMNTAGGSLFIKSRPVSIN